MKRSEIKKLMQEVKEELIISEGIIDKLLFLFLSPKIKKDVDKLKNSPDWKELVQKINTTRDEMEMYNKRLEKYLKDCEENAKWFRKRGLKPPVDCSNVEKYKNKY